MIYIVMFIAGMLFNSIIMPVIDLLVQSIQSKCEVGVSKNNLEISRNNVAIEKLSQSCECDSVQAIGFSVDSEDYYDDDDEEEIEERGRKRK